MNILDTIKDTSVLKNVNLTKDETLFYEGDKCEYIGVVTKGLLKISSFLVNGKEIIFNEIYPFQIFGNNLIFSTDPYYKGNIIAKEDTALFLIHKEELLTLLKTNDEFLIYYLELQSDFGKDLNGKIKLLSFEKAEDRLMFFLKENGNSYTYSSISDLASQLNLQRETLSRLISKLVKNNVIVKENKKLLLKNL